MHRRAYARWCEKGEAAERAALGAVQVWLDRMKARHDPASSALSVLILEAGAIYVR